MKRIKKIALFILFSGTFIGPCMGADSIEGFIKRSETATSSDEPISKAGSETGINPRFNKKPLKASVLLQNQPNPASDYTVIYFYLAQSGPVSLKLYTLSGRLIGYFIDGFQNSGWYSVGFYADFLAKGEYCYRLTTPSVTSIRTMLVVK